MTSTLIPEAFTIACTGDVCRGDIVLFEEAVFGGSFHKPRFLGTRRIMAAVVSDSYGAVKQQHTFTLDVIASEGFQPVKEGRTTRKGRNVYRNGTYRMPWRDEAMRMDVLSEKHDRGATARADRAERLAGGAR